MYTMVTDSSTRDRLSHHQKFDEPFGVRFHFENFWEPMSVGVRVVLLVEDMTRHSTSLYRVWKLLGFTYVCTLTTKR
jgi:hypothetical protein